MLAPGENVLRLGMLLIADAGAVIACGGDDEVQRLLAGGAGALGHHIEQLSVGLAEQLVKDAGVDVVAIFAGHFRGQRLIDASVGQVDQPLLRFDNIDALLQKVGVEHHVLRNIKYDAGLCTVVGTAIDFCALLVVGTEHIECNGGGQLTFSIFLAQFDVGSVELPVAVLLDDAEQIPDNLLLPGKQIKRLAIPDALRVLERLYEQHGSVCTGLVVMGSRQHEAGRLVFELFSFLHLHPLPLQQSHRPGWWRSESAPGGRAPCGSSRRSGRLQ